MWDSIRKINQILNKKERLQLALLLLAIIVTAFTQTLGVASVMPFIGLIMNPDLVYENQYLLWLYEKLNFSDNKAFIIFSGLAMLTIVLLSNAILALNTWQKTKFALMNNHRLSMLLLKKYLAMPYPYFLNQNSADLSKNVLSEVNHLTYSFIMTFLHLISKGLIVLFILIMLLIVEPVFSLITLLLIGGAYSSIFFSLKKKLRERGLLRFEANRKKFKAVTEAFGGIKEIKIMQVEPYFLDKYKLSSLELTGHALWSTIVSLMPRFALEGIAFGGIIVFVLFLFITKEDALQVVPLTALFAFAGYRLLPAIQEIFASLSGIQFHQAVLNRLHADITASEPLEQQVSLVGRALPEPLNFSKQIELKSITYRYPNTAEPVLRNITLSIKQHTSVGFVGPTGSGKTTLVDIILGLLLPAEGQLIVDSVPVDSTNRLNWQRNLGYVPQFIYLSDDTIARNIAFGRPDEEIDRDDLIRAAQIANIHDFIVGEHPAGYDTLVGERGIRLSGGQRQRIGIARALYHDPAVLIFDEATSALDGVTEEAVLTAMDKASRSKTIIIIAHRLTTVEPCDIIYLLDRGKITDQGTYSELLKSNRYFRSMAKVKL